MTRLRPWTGACPHLAQLPTLDGSSRLRMPHSSVRLFWIGVPEVQARDGYHRMLTPLHMLQRLQPRCTSMHVIDWIVALQVQRLLQCVHAVITSGHTSEEQLPRHVQAHGSSTG
jgi:hypothetical protein